MLPNFSAEKSVRNGLLSNVDQQRRANGFARGQSARRFKPGPVHTGQRAAGYRVSQGQSRVSVFEFNLFPFPVFKFEEHHPEYTYQNIS